MQIGFPEKLELTPSFWAILGTFFVGVAAISTQWGDFKKLPGLVDKLIEQVDRLDDTVHRELPAEHVTIDNRIKTLEGTVGSRADVVRDFYTLKARVDRGEERYADATEDIKDLNQKLEALQSDVGAMKNSSVRIESNVENIIRLLNEQNKTDNRRWRDEPPPVTR